MRIVLDLESVRETARLLDGVADEYEAIAASLRHRHGLGGVTGSHRNSVFATLDWTASRLTSVANAHRRSAADLRVRVERASERKTSPIYAGVAMTTASSVDTSAVALDRDGDGVTDAYAIDRDGDGRHETFVADTDHDGRFDTAFEMDETGELRAASFDADGDGHVEGFLAVTGSGVVRLTDSDLDGYHEGVTWDSQPFASQPTIMTSPRPGFEVVVDPSAQATPLSLTVGADRSGNAGWSTTIDPGATSHTAASLTLPAGSHRGPVYWDHMGTVIGDTPDIVTIGPVSAGSGFGIAVNTAMTHELAAAQNAAYLSEDHSVGGLLAEVYGPREPTFADHLFDPTPYDQPSIVTTLLTGRTQYE